MAEAVVERKIDICKNVTANFLVPIAPDAPIYQFVPISMVAWNSVSTKLKSLVMNMISGNYKCIYFLNLSGYSLDFA